MIFRNFALNRLEIKNRTPILVVHCDAEAMTGETARVTNTYVVPNPELLVEKGMFLELIDGVPLRFNGYRYSDPVRIIEPEEIDKRLTFRTQFMMHVREHFTTALDFCKWVHHGIAPKEEAATWKETMEREKVEGSIGALIKQRPSNVKPEVTLTKREKKQIGEAAERILLLYAIEKALEAHDEVLFMQLTGMLNKL